MGTNTPTEKMIGLYNSLEEKTEMRKLIKELRKTYKDFLNILPTNDNEYDKMMYTIQRLNSILIIEGESPITHSFPKNEKQKF